MTHQRRWSKPPWPDAQHSGATNPFPSHRSLSTLRKEVRPKTDPPPSLLLFPAVERRRDGLFLLSAFPFFPFFLLFMQKT
jgi:hypothetical protein